MASSSSVSTLPIQKSRGALRWTLRLPAAPAAVMTELERVKKSDVRVLAREPSRMVLACREDDVVWRVAVELRADGDGAELVAHDEGRSVSPDSVKATLIAACVLCMGLGMDSSMPFKYLMYATSLPSLLYLIAMSIDAHRRRETDFRRVVRAVDRAVDPLKTRDERPYRGLAPGRRRP